MLRARAPGNTNGAQASASSISSSSAVSARLLGRSPESSRIIASLPSTPSDRVQALRTPQQDQHHQKDVGEQRHLGKQEARVVRHQPDQQRADEAAGGGAEAADEDDDEDQHV